MFEIPIELVLATQDAEPVPDWWQTEKYLAAKEKLEKNASEAMRGSNLHHLSKHIDSMAEGKQNMIVLEFELWCEICGMVGKEEKIRQRMDLEQKLWHLLLQTDRQQFGSAQQRIQYLEFELSHAEYRLWLIVGVFLMFTFCGSLFYFFLN